MIKGTIYVTYDINLCIANLNTCKNIIIADEPDMYQVPDKIGGSLLLPPYEALAAIIDGDEDKFRYEYLSYLTNDITVNKFINIILQALLAGTNIIFLMDREGPKFDTVLKEFFAMSFGIFIGDSSNQFQFDINYLPIILNRLYFEDEISAGYYLTLFPIEIPFDSYSLRKLAYEHQVPFTGEYDMNNYFKKMSKINKNGGLIRNVVQRIG